MRDQALVVLIVIACTAACDTTRVPRSAASEKQRASQPTGQHSAARKSNAPVASAVTVPPASANSGSRAPTSNDGAASGCAAPDVRRAMTEQLLLDEEFRGYICEEEPCTAQDFLERSRFTEVVLRDAPHALGCIVGPLHEAMTRIYGVFVLNGQTPNLSLVFQGIDISVDPAFRKPGFKDLVGTERVGPGTWVTHRYVWHHRAYVLESTTEAVGQ